MHDYFLFSTKFRKICNFTIDSNQRQPTIDINSRPKVHRTRAAAAEHTRKTTEVPPVKRRKQPCTVIQRHQPVTKPEKCTNVVIGQVVLCRMRGFGEWPSFVTHISGNMISVEFFGDHTTHTAAIEHFYLFEESVDTILGNLRKYKRPLYTKSVREAEHALGIPADKSIFNRI